MTETLEDPKKDNGSKETLDDILDLDFGNDDFLKPVEEKTPEVSKVQETATTTTLFPIEVEEVIPSLRGNDFPVDYTQMVLRIQGHYRLLPKLDYDSIYEEISDLSVKSNPTPTLQVVGDEIQKVQGAKDRLSEIFIDVIKVYNYKKRAVDILRDSWGKFTTEKNAEGRKGDASFRLSNFELDLASTEALLKAITHIFRNLDSLHDALSRRITISQLTMKLHDFGRTALPDYDFNRTGEKSNETVLKNDSDKEDSGDPKLISF